MAEGLAHPEKQDEIVKREALRYAVQSQIFCKYCGKVLDVRSSVLLDGSDHGGRMNLLHAEEYDLAVERAGGLDKLQEGLRYKVDVCDGRELF